ncbi:MAG: ribonuclease Y [candidate division KSB1 bacterium]|nr:ribonuclease Y [candidate division KSB1 bacterium]MDQ7066032.1 ribonuclease Y [candidate division KSB1 bacterium]
MIITVAGAALVGAVLSYVLIQWKLRRAGRTAKDLIRDARREIEREKNRIIIKAKEDWFKVRDEQESKLRAKMAEVEELENQLLEKEKKLNRREEILKQREGLASQKEHELKSMKDALHTREEELNRIIQQQNIELSRVTGMSIDEAKEKLIENLKQQYRQEAAELYKQIIDEAKANANREAKRIISMAIERQASEYASESSVAVVSLPNEEVKGRIIGRDGRNIKAFEQLSGVKLIIDDTPEAVVLSSFDPVKREIARIALEKMIQNGKIHPQRIEETLKQAEQEVERTIWRAGNEVVASVGIGKIHPDLIRTLGRLYYRTSYGQNVLMHSKEVALLCGAMAAELKIDAKLARRAGLLHDIGKAVSQSQEGTHTQLGVELCKKYNENPIVLNAIASHHEDVPADNIYSVLVAAADAISGSRPGARRDTLEGYVRRIERLEKLADSFQGVEKAFAISAGREVRVVVQPDKVSDAEADLLASEIAKKIQEDMDYPGQVKVTVIRERRAAAYA